MIVKNCICHAWRLTVYEVDRMPFGLVTAPATFQRAMEQALADLTYSICFCYLDDIIIFSNSITEHCNRLRAVLTRFWAKFWQHDLRLNLAKCKFAARKVHYLGHMISDDGVSPLPSKIEAIKQISCAEDSEGIPKFFRVVRILPTFY
jgi:hypothetical protein